MSQPQFLYLTTAGWKTGKRHQIEIWFVEHSGKYYVVSEHYERSHWVRNILRNPQAEFSIGGSRFKVDGRKIQAEPRTYRRAGAW